MTLVTIQREQIMLQHGKLQFDNDLIVSFWFYTRSFLEDELLAALSELASQPNCQAFLSIDSENFEQGLRAFAKYPGIWKLALLQQDEEELSPELLPALQEQVQPGQIISFPYHRAGYHVTPIEAEPLTSVRK